MHSLKDLYLHPENKEIIQALIDDLQENKKDFIPFIGAGMSSPIFPLWRAAILDIMSGTHIHPDTKTSIISLLDTYRYEDAATELKKTLGNDRWLRRIKGTFDSEKIGDDKLISMPANLLPQIFPSSVIVTTNFDQMLENVYRPHTPFVGRFTMAVDSPDQRGLVVRNRAHYLVKLHGCITAADRLVLTKEQYDDCYGKDLDSKNISFLREIFQSKIMLFLGCGLEQDRTMQLIKKISDSEYRPHYAILEMKNPLDSAEFFDREKQLSDLNIRCIWYPEGKHEYVNTILQLLLPPDTSNLSARSDCLGRDEIVQDIVDILCTRHTAVEVCGEPGIGKTTVCQEVLNRCRGKFKRIVIADFSQVFTKDVALVTLLSGHGSAIQDTVPLERQLEHWHTNEPNLLLYMDNLEDPLKSAEFKQWFLRFISVSKWAILYSSRQHVADRNIRSKSIPELDPQNAKSLFISLWGRSIDPMSDAALDILIRKLDRHPLSIVLVASQWLRFASIQAALDEWDRDPFHDGMQVDMEGRHQNLRKAIHMSYMSVKDNIHALTIWAVLSFIPSALSEELFTVLFSDDLAGYQASADLLLRQSLLKVDKTGYIMLNPIRNMVFSFTDDDTLRQSAIAILRKQYTLIFLRADQLQSSERMQWHNLAIDNMGTILEFLQRTIDYSDENIDLIKRMNNHFSYSPRLSLHLLITLMENPLTQSAHAYLNEYSGDLESRLGQIDDAKLHYSQAEKLYRDEQSNLGLANVLQSMGDLESRLGQIDDAKLHYSQAEKLYRDEQDNLGLAYTRAELALISIMENDKQKAIKYIEKAKVCANLSCATHVIEYVDAISQTILDAE